MRGIVAWFQNGRGFGFITPNGGGSDLFCHWSQIRGMTGFKSLRQGERVDFETGPDEKTGRIVAKNVFPLDPPMEDSDGSRTDTDR
jgi:CspA family cold shock protein